LFNVRRFLVFALLACASLGWLAVDSAAAPNRAPPLVVFDGPLWDISDEGLPYKITLAWPATLDPLSRLLRATEARWTLGAGYAVVYDDVDTGTNKVTSRGRDGVMWTVGRQTLWPLPLRLPGGELRLENEAGLHYAARSLPADGTHLSFYLLGGFEWAHAPASPRTWLAGVRWLHLSHGGLFGRNGGYDGLVFRLGCRWRW
jgi:hypothetical protein